MNNQELIDKIRRAFADMPFPGEDQLVDGSCRASEEVQALVREFRSQERWQDLTPEFLSQAPEGWGSALSFFSDAAWRFYLPAWMIADIENTLISGGEPTTRLCSPFAIGPKAQKIAQIYGGGTMEGLARRSFEPFNAAQVSAIVAYLWWELDSNPWHESVEWALEAYWLEREEELLRRGGVLGG